MKKRGSNHTEIILAFLIFIAAVGLALFLFNPGSGDRKINTYLTYSFTEVERRTEVDVEVYSVVLNPSVIHVDTIGVDLPGVLGNVRVETYGGQGLASGRTGDTIFFRNDSLSWNEIEFVNIYLSEGLPESTSITGTHNSTFYELSTSYEKKILSEALFNDLVQQYTTDYDSLRDDFNLKIGIGFSLVFEDGFEIVAEREIPVGLEVYSDTRRVEVLRSNGEHVFADLNVWVW